MGFKKTFSRVVVRVRLEIGSLLSESVRHNKNENCKRTPLLVPFDCLDDDVKQSNLSTAQDSIKTIMGFGYSITSPNLAEGKLVLSFPILKTIDSRVFRILDNTVNMKTYCYPVDASIESGLLYYEVELVSQGPVRIGWTNRFAQAPDSKVTASKLFIYQPLSRALV